MENINFLFNKGHVDIPVDVSIRDFVFRIWVSNWEKTAADEVVYSYTADTYCKLIFAFSQQESGQFIYLNSTVVGPASTFTMCRTDHNMKFIGVSLYPFVMPLLFGLDTRELKNAYIDLLDAIGRESNRLADQLQMVTDTMQRVHIITDFLKLLSIGNSMRDEHKTFFRVAQNIRKKRGSVNVPQLAADNGYSIKQFERRFNAVMGLNPKSYARVVRFESFINDYADHFSLTDTAYKLGYFDQAHFINDVKNLTGMNPRMYLSIFNLGAK